MTTSVPVDFMDVAVVKEVLDRLDKRLERAIRDRDAEQAQHLRARIEYLELKLFAQKIEDANGGSVRRG